MNENNETQDRIRKQILGPILYKLCKEKKATDEHIEERSNQITKRFNDICTHDDIMNLCNLTYVDIDNSCYQQESKIDALSGSETKFPNLKKLIMFNEMLESQTECPICYEDLDETTRSAGDCGHLFHKKCLDNLIERDIKRCPTCREYMNYQSKPSVSSNCESLFQGTRPEFYKSKAIDAHSLKCLKWAHENGYPWSEFDTINAAKNGYIEMLRYAHQNGAPWDSRTCAGAAEFGNLNCLRYAHENGCLWDISTIMKAASYNKLDCLKYAHENGCPWNEDVSFTAAFSGHLDILKYLVENNCPVTEKVLRMLEKQIEEWSSTTIREVIYWKRCLEYLKSKGWKKGFFTNKWKRNT
jgi:hypothetical protein